MSSAPRREAGSPRADHLGRIVARTAAELVRRRRFARAIQRAAGEAAPIEHDASAARLVRAGAPLPHVIAEVKFKSPSAGQIRRRVAGEAVRVGEAYAAAGASAVSVLADMPDFGSGALDVRRVAAALDGRAWTPVLFKGFVLDELHLDLARAVGARLVLLLVRALSPARLHALVDEARARGLVPVVEAADAAELAIALETPAEVVDVNARDLRTFAVDPDAAAQALAPVPADRVAVFMSGIRSREDFRWAAQTRADAVLVGEGLMRPEAAAPEAEAPDTEPPDTEPGARLREWVAG